MDNLEKPVDEQREERLPARFNEPDANDGIHPTFTNVTNDTEKGSSGYATSTTGLDHKAETSKAERRLLLKLGDCFRLSVQRDNAMAFGISPFSC